jgi:glycosyltransferase involved in cell wall biosynthesis
MISICMPYWNRSKELQRTMDSYAKQYPDLQLEFSICDDGSLVPLKAQAPNWKVTRLPAHAGALNPCVPINEAIRQATGDVVVLTNPEVEHRERVLWNMMQLLQTPNDYVMAGCIEATTGARISGEGTPYGTGGRLPIPSGADLHFCVMFYKSLWERVGGFDEEYRTGLGCDDNDWVWRLHKVGVNFIRLPQDVYHYRTPHRWTGTLEKNAALLKAKWGHLEEYQRCAS